MGLIGNIYYMQSMYTEALEWYEESLAWKKKMSDGNDNGSILGILSNLGSTYFHLGDFENALLCYERVESCIDSSSAFLMKEQRASILESIGSVFARLREYEKAMNYYERALAIRTTDSLTITQKDEESNQMLLTKLNVANALRSEKDPYASGLSSLSASTCEDSSLFDTTSSEGNSSYYESATSFSESTHFG